MKRFVAAMLPLILATCAALPAYAALSDASARAKIRSLFGGRGVGIKLPGPTDSKWDLGVAIDTHECGKDFILIGRSTTWEKAIAAAQAKVATFPVMNGDFWAIAAQGQPSSVQLLVDARPLGAPFSPDPTAGRWSTQTGASTIGMLPGLHVVCADSRDIAGKQLGAEPALIMVK